MLRFRPLAGCYGLLLAGALIAPTEAIGQGVRQCVEFGYRQKCSRTWPHDRCWTERYCMRHAYVDSWRSDNDDGRRRFRGDRSECRSMRKVTGDQHLTVDGAKKAANDAWSGNVRFHLGERFMDLSNAREIAYDCSRSSIKEGGVTTLGQSLTRCEVEAIPCAPVRQLDGGGPRGAVEER